MDFTKAIELNPKSAETYSFRATAYSGKGKYATSQDKLLIEHAKKRIAELEKQK